MVHQNNYQGSTYFFEKSGVGKRKAVAEELLKNVKKIQSSKLMRTFTEMRSHIEFKNLNIS